MRFGTESIYIEPLLNAEAVRFRALLWAVRNGRAVPRLPGAKRQGRAIVLGEFGGLGLPVEGHTWLQKGNWGYRSFTDPRALTEAYIGLLTKLHPLIGAATGYSAAVYTQTTDVETEVNGLLTYDREVIKVDVKETAAWHEYVNNKQRGVDWQFRIDDARTKLKSLYPKSKT